MENFNTKLKREKRMELRKAMIEFHHAFTAHAAAHNLLRDYQMKSAGEGWGLLEQTATDMLEHADYILTSVVCRISLLAEPHELDHWEHQGAYEGWLEAIKLGEE